MFRGGIGPPEIILILLVVVLLFGAKKLPETARGLGRSLRIFKAETKGMKEDDAVDATLHQGVAGDLQHGAFQAAVRRLPEEGVDLGGFRGGEVAHGGAGLLAQAEAHGGEEGASALGPL